MPKVRKFIGPSTITIHQSFLYALSIKSTIDPNIHSLLGQPEEGF
jgi:hypothetical protein